MRIDELEVARLKVGELIVERETRPGSVPDGTSI
jgi:hypothetical protein